uniref:Uncharacterized protein n=1 Tax=Sphaerodactylus townsendi TaxID=933632 RepID=A0ACB8FYL0_9SAUR
MEDYDIRSAASILASVKEQEARFERLTRALEEERRNVSLQLERANQPSDRVSACNIGNGQPLATAWQQLVLQNALLGVSHQCLIVHYDVGPCEIAFLVICDQSESCMLCYSMRRSKGVVQGMEALPQTAGWSSSALTEILSQTSQSFSIPSSQL